MLEAGRFRRTRLRAPVISVGNLAVGGRGKTPLVAAHGADAARRGHEVAILSRGYGGSFRGRVSSSATAARPGDAPRSGRRAGDARPRPARRGGRGGPRPRVVGRWSKQRFGPRVHVLDDGFQHLRLARDLDIVCVDAGDLRDRPLPAGLLREVAGRRGRADVSSLLDARATGRRLSSARACSRRRQPSWGSSTAAER